MTDQDPHPLVDYLYGELSDEEAAATERALETSPELRADLEGHVDTLGVLRSLDLSEAPPSGLARLAFGEAERRPQPLLRRLRRAWMGPTAGLAVAAAVVLVAVIVPGGLSLSPRLSERAAPSVDHRDLAEFRSEPEPEGAAPSAVEPDLAELGSEPQLDDAVRAAAPPPAAARPARSAPKASDEGGRVPSSADRSAVASGGAAAPKGRASGPGRRAPARTFRRARRPSSPAADEIAQKKDARSSSEGAAGAGFEAPVNLAVAAEEERPEDFDPTADRAADDLESDALGQLAGFAGGDTPSEGEPDPNAGRQASAARTLIQAAVQARAQGHFGEARSALDAAAGRAYRLPLLGDILLLRAEIELEDQQYTQARTFAARAARVEDFAEKARARALAQRARALETQDRN